MMRPVSTLASAPVGAHHAAPLPGTWIRPGSAARASKTVGARLSVPAIHRPGKPGHGKSCPYRGIFCIAVILGLGVGRVAAQPSAPALRVGVTTGGAWVYHPLQAPLGGAVWVERQEADGTFTPLNALPLVPAQRGDEFAARLGAVYEAVQADADRPTPTDVLLRLRRDPLAARLLTFAYPEVADALGRRAFDATATPGTTRTYRARAVNADGGDVGDPVTATVRLDAVPPPPVGALAGRLERRALTLSWTYARADAARDDGVIGFRVACGDSLRTPRPVLRTATETTYHARFSVNATGQTLACLSLIHI